MGGRVAALEQDQRARGWLAWHSGLASQQFDKGKFPKLSEFMGVSTKPEIPRMTGPQIAANMKRWSGRFDIRRTGPG